MNDASLRNIKLTIEYDGTNFKGWQIQKKGERTVQEEITQILNLLCHEKISLIGSGRTDTGVHALAQIANFKTTSQRKLSQIKSALNGELPKDIVIHDIKEVPLKFHAQHSVKSKVYCYTVNNNETPSAIFRRQQLHYAYELDVELMKKEMTHLLGTHDFKSFQGTNPDNKKKNIGTIRTMKSAKLRHSKGIVTLEFEADGFLYKMVRNLAGTILEIGSGRLPKGSIKRILAQKNRQFAGQTAKPHGLCLMKVKY